MFGQALAPSQSHLRMLALSWQQKRQEPSSLLASSHVGQMCKFGRTLPSDAASLSAPKPWQTLAMMSEAPAISGRLAQKVCSESELYNK